MASAMFCAVPRRQDFGRSARRRLAQVLRWVVCELLRVCVNSGWHGCVSGRFEAGHYL